MKTNRRKTPYFITDSEKRSALYLMEKMNISKRELTEIISVSGVTYSKILELMQLSKYAFVVKDEAVGCCRPCKTGPGNLNLERFS